MRVLAVPDKPGWALEHHCRDLQSALAKECRIDVEACPPDQTGRTRLISMAKSGNYDCIYPTWHELSLAAYQAVGDARIQRSMLCGLHDFHTWDSLATRGAKTANASTCAPSLVSALKNFTRTVAISRALQRSFSEIHPLLAHHGVNTSFFRPSKKRQQTRRKLHIGWVGTLTNTKNNYDLFVRIREMLEPRAEFLEAKTSRLDERPLTREEMVKFYNTLDILVVTSYSEGGPMPPVEASGCGVPTISPPVGAMPEFIRDGLDGYIVDSYEPGQFVEKILHLSRNREVLFAMRNRCLEKASGPWNLSLTAQRWLEAFKAVADDNHPASEIIE